MLHVHAVKSFLQKRLHELKQIYKGKQCIEKCIVEVIVILEGEDRAEVARVGPLEPLRRRRPILKGEQILYAIGIVEDNKKAPPARV